MGRLIYKKGVKAVLWILQVAAAGILACCCMNINFWLEDSFSIKEMSRSYEESDLFFRQVDSVLAEKINGQKNTELFEVDGAYAPDKGIDIQSYGTESSYVQDMNTTYSLDSLLEFARSGGLASLHEAISAAVTAESEGQNAGEMLAGKADQLETIYPVTGISLAECSRWYSDPANFVLSMYIRLDEVCTSIYNRYQEYTTLQEESWSKEAPSNLRYCIENTATGDLYTNTGMETYEEAVAAIQADSDFISLYEGERSFDIMVTNPDHVLNQDAQEWFMVKRYVNTNERVFLAVDIAYPVSDALQIYAGYFARREEMVNMSLFGAFFCALVILGGFVVSMMAAGWQEGRVTPVLQPADHVPTELAAGVYMILAVLYVIVFGSREVTADSIFAGEWIPVAVIVSSAYLVFLSASTSLIRRIRTKTLWSNSICRMLILTWQRVTTTRTASVRLLILYIGFFSLNFMFPLVFERVGIFMTFVLDMAALLYLLRDMAGKKTVWEGIHQISAGDLDYRIDTSALQGENFEMATAVNEMGDGLQKAVDSIVKNERLKAELITNVSHDLKTPLTSIVNYVDLLKRENLEGERVQHYIEVLDQKSQRLRQLTEDLVEASKISSGNVELQMMRMQFQSMISQAYGEFQERLEEKGLTPVWEMDREPIAIMADGRQLWRILENLLGNIYKYALENTRIDITLHRMGDMAVFSIENTSREKLTVDAEELMGRFVRGDKSRNTEGSGLGLSIAQSLTQLQGGLFELHVDGELFRVTIQFPVAREGI